MMQLARRFNVGRIVDDVVELVWQFASHMRQREPRELRRELGSQCEGARHRRKTRKFISRMFAPSNISAVGIWTLITAFSSGSSSSAVGTILKLAAIGV